MEITRRDTQKSILAKVAYFQNERCFLTYSENSNSPGK